MAGSEGTPHIEAFGKPGRREPEGMICPVCGIRNDDLATVCRGCRGFLQARVDALDLWPTALGVLEKPRRTFRRIAIASRKNHATLLSALAGCLGVFAAIWWRAGGERFDGLLPLLRFGFMAGPPAGVGGVFLSAAVLTLTGRLLGGRGCVRTLRGILAYAAVPVGIALLTVFPVSVAVFGKYFFSLNPPPSVLRPVAYAVLLGLYALFGAWSLALAVEGTAIAHGIGRWRAGLALGLGAAPGLGLCFLLR
ncbi:MAG: Yip1 family protein [Bacteroidota bacterium]